MVAIAEPYFNPGEWEFDIMVISCNTYLQYIAQVKEIERIKMSWKSPMIFLADFNAKASAWRYKKLDDKGVLLLETFHRMDLHPLRASGGVTFHRNGRSLVADFMFTDTPAMRNVERSVVLDLHSGSDHCYFLHVLGRRDVNAFVPLFRWNPKSLDVD